jgi:ClpP class serine protease
MTNAVNPPTPAPTDPAAKIPQAAFLNIITELDVNRDQLSKRQEIIRQVEGLLSSRYGASNRMISYIVRFGHPRSTMNSADIAALETVLNSISGAEQLNVLLHSPGGDGTIIEKMVDMCRNHLAGGNRKLRVIVPNIAKSAATLFALGADEIVMGYCSELGPIDPQVQIAVSGVIQWISALAFVESRDNLMKQVAEASKKNEPTAGFLQQLAGLNIPYTQEMENVIGFAQQTAANLLDRYMLKSKIKDDRARRTQANMIAKKLLSKQLFPVHGQYIDGATAKRELELEVEVLDKNDDLWKMIWEYYIRCEVQMNLSVQPPMVKIKLFESAVSSLITQDTAS